MRRAFLLLMLAMAALPAAANFVVRNPDAITENPRYCSSNGVYCLVVREIPGIRDFHKGRAGDWPSASYVPTAALYEIRGGTRKRIAKWKRASTRVDYLVADSGRAIVGVSRGPAFATAYVEPHLMTIHRPDGSLVRIFFAEELITKDDLFGMRVDRVSPKITLRDDERAHREVAVVGIRDAGLRVALDDGAVLDAKRDVYPERRGWAIAATPDMHKPAVPSSKDFDECAKDAQPITSSELLARAIDKPNADYPMVAAMVHVEGRVWVTIVVGDDGRVLCTSESEQPFGIAAAAEKTAKQWRFAPGPKVVGDVVFDFAKRERP